MRLLAVILALSLAACSGDSPPPPPPPSTLSATFTPSSTPPGAAIFVSGPASPQQGTITLDLMAQSLLASTYAIACDLDFNPSIVTFSSAQNGAFFEAGGAVSYQVVTASGNTGKLVIGVTLLGASGGVSGSGRIVSLRFTVQNNVGSTPLAFSGNSLLNSTGQSVSGISWAAGTVETRR